VNGLRVRALDRALLGGPSTSPLGVMETHLLGDRFIVYAQGHHGYPFPAIDYGAKLYEGWCQHCGIHGAQRSPVAVRGVLKAPHSAFLQLNWMYDVFFVRTDVVEGLRSAGLSGLGFGAVASAKANEAIASHQQLLVTTIVPCVDTSRLKIVTCRESNEEARWKLPEQTLAQSSHLPYCGRTKHHPPSTAVLRAGYLASAPDICLSAEWFGSGGCAFRLTVASRRFMEVIRSRGWRGLEFRAAVVDGQAQHDT